MDVASLQKHWLSCFSRQNIKILAFAMLRGYTDIDDDGAPAAVALLACLVTLESSAHGSRPEQLTKS